MPSTTYAGYPIKLMKFLQGMLVAVILTLALPFFTAVWLRVILTAFQLGWHVAH